MPADRAVELHGVHRRYGRGRTAVHTLRGIDLTLPPRTFTAVTGPSGSGKYAFLVAIAGIVLGTAIVLATLVPMMNGLTGQWPCIPPPVYGSLVAAIVALGLTAAGVPARAALRGETLEP
ncbi:hypothetical protein [Streptomyces sp. WM6386]|uniref:hypothetical protein n=1 Tax=Streptomyces sp. WM6386 TaxID=1415558 RepID=UPI00061967AA|nr:hypothetical protein TN53_19810 [Streptomyces sp. WM6386]